MLNKANFAERDCHLGQDKNQDDLAFALAQGRLTQDSAPRWIP